MFVYEKKLQYPVRITTPNPKLAAVIISQYGGPDGELGASLRYLSQRYSMPYPELKGLLTDIGTEELGHLEMIGTIVHQLTRNLTEEQIKTAGFDTYFVDRTTGVYPTSAPAFTRMRPASQSSVALKAPKYSWVKVPISITTSSCSIVVLTSIEPASTYSFNR